ncbi:sensor histidine kinase [[Actinomadura] parvosata subsp. kistnae]|uniref:Signal transduction histidine kinase subgroup 3 dimerisation and phosphoacceptor domain-containing protein n=1 Tax=[Actinomadura] parvosata subsp. kistnae TaxID=1909395 RepID=A0A1U9ZRR4_9ACTN|nr:hypothetical protein [Nonomuraea sp. ATCC 55076]AQZ60631.1 hypothetical protein BKM31_03120 [Nonomuraea sp. ATCC 55076]SPL90780.1 sensor histidine kinase [Actinomadura parvosata subsp. kistnae]
MGFWRSDRVVRLAPAGAVACSGLLPLLQVALAFSYPGNDTRTGLWSVAATAAYLPLHLRHVWYAARAARQPAGHWTFAAMAVIVLAATPVAGNMWPRAYTSLAVSAVLVLPGPWAFAAYLALVLAAAPASLLLGLPWNAAPWLTLSTLCGSGAVLMLVWLSAALVRLRSAREVLAQRAVAQERRRIDDDLRHTLGTALESLAARGTRATSLLTPLLDGQAELGERTELDRRAALDARAALDRRAELDRRRAELVAELSRLADDSRRTLADARQRVRGYRQPSLRAELDTAAALLSAAGIETRLHLPRTGVPDTIAPQPRAALRATVTRLLRADGVRACTITAVAQPGGARLEVRTDDTMETIDVRPATDPTKADPTKARTSETSPTDTHPSQTSPTEAGQSQTSPSEARS